MEIVQVAIEYMILIPMLILQIFIFPLVATTLMSNWTDSRRTIAIQEVASHLASSMQQLYSSLNHEETIPDNVNVTYKLDFPQFIEDYSYTGTAKLQNVSDSSGSKVLQLTLSYVGVSISTTTVATFGNNTEWKPSTFVSNATSPSIVAEKYWNQTIGTDMIRMSFG